MDDKNFQGLAKTCTHVAPRGWLCVNANDRLWSEHRGRVEAAAG